MSLAEGPDEGLFKSSTLVAPELQSLTRWRYVPCYAEVEVNSMKIQAG